ncbi:hypothetical protein [Nocardia sp. NPDC057668]|uniref:hypothetical protein n=1 Tax=Nocardia sp. NPDC057668 TaxID=3346202 RepID=UPI00366DE93E
MQVPGEEFGRVRTLAVRLHEGLTRAQCSNHVAQQHDMAGDLFGEIPVSGQCALHVRLYPTGQSPIQQ